MRSATESPIFSYSYSSEENTNCYDFSSFQQCLNDIPHDIFTSTQRVSADDTTSQNKTSCETSHGKGGGAVLKPSFMLPDTGIAINRQSFNFPDLPVSFSSVQGRPFHYYNSIRVPHRTTIFSSNHRFELSPFAPSFHTQQSSQRFSSPQPQASLTSQSQHGPCSPQQSSQAQSLVINVTSQSHSSSPQLCKLSRTKTTTSPSVSSKLSRFLLKPNQQQPSFFETTLSQPSLSQPSLSQSSLTQPLLSQPSLSQPSLSQSSRSQPSLSQSSLTQPSLSQSSLSQPSLSQSSLLQPSLSQSSLSQPSLTKPSLIKPTLAESSLEKPSLFQPPFSEATFVKPSLCQPSVPQTILTNSSTPSLFSPSLPQASMMQTSLEKPAFTPRPFTIKSEMQTSLSQPCMTEQSLTKSLSQLSLTNKSVTKVSVTQPPFLMQISVTPPFISKTSHTQRSLHPWAKTFQPASHPLRPNSHPFQSRMEPFQVCPHNRLQQVHAQLPYLSQLPHIQHSNVTAPFYYPYFNPTYYSPLPPSSYFSLPYQPASTPSALQQTVKEDIASQQTVKEIEVEAYIPCPPYYFDTVSMRYILSAYGDVFKDNFYRPPGDIHGGNYSFTINLHTGKELPEVISYGGTTMTVKQVDKTVLCRFCDQEGHRTKSCPQKKKLDDVLKKELERAQINKDIINKHFVLPTSTDYTVTK